MPTPDQWLSILAQRLDYQRPKFSLLRRYYDGDAPLPEGSEGVRDAYKEFQRKSRSNFARPIVRSRVDRMIPAGFRVGDSEQDDDRVRQMWKRNRLGVWSADVHTDMVIYGVGYTCTQVDAGGRVDITYQSPFQTITDHDPSKPDRVRAGLMVWRDDVFGIDHAYLHVPGELWKFTRPTEIERDGIRLPILTVSGDWTAENEEPIPTGLTEVPIVPFVNPAGCGEYEPHLDLLDRINWNVLQRLVIIAISAYRQRAVKGELPEVDEDGNPVDYGEILKPGPGALWMLPEGTEIWESAQSDLGGVMLADQSDLKTLAAVSSTPMSALIPDATNQSAEGAAAAREALVFQTERIIESARVGWGKATGLGLALEDRLPEVPEVDVDFLPADRPSMAERFDALSKAGSDLPWRSKMTRILGLDGDEVDRMATERAEDILLAATVAPPAQAPTDTETVTDNGEES